VLNGHTIAGPSSDLFSLTSIGAVPNSDFVPGVNTLQIVMSSNDNTDDGVRFEGAVGGQLASVPEPAMFISLLGMGGLGIGGAILRRRYGAKG
jgi:hypothetical protein